jgi:hypothetical protein
VCVATSRSCADDLDDDSLYRDLLDRCLALSSSLGRLLACQQQLQHAAPHPRLSALLTTQHDLPSQDAAAEERQQGSLMDALQAVAAQTAWPEAAQRATQLLRDVAAADGGAAHMQA